MFMQRVRFLMPLLASACLAIAAGGAHAQGGRCSNNNINLAFNTALHRAPNGTGYSGECNPANYGGGSWSSQADLVKRVGAAVYCSNNPWVGQIYAYEFNRYPNWSECSAYYGTNAGSYMALDAAIKTYVRNGEQLTYSVASNGALLDLYGVVVAAPGTYVINAGGANVINAGGANVVNAGGANVINMQWLVTPQPGMVINAGGANIAAQRTIFSNGKRVITATILRR